MGWGGSGVRVGGRHRSEWGTGWFQAKAEGVWVRVRVAARVGVGQSVSQPTCNSAPRIEGRRADCCTSGSGENTYRVRGKGQY